MYRYFAGLLILAVLVGCEARSQVAMDKITERIDKMLGELDVKRKKIDNQIKELETSLSEVNKKRINAEVRLEGYRDKTKSISDRLTRIKTVLAKYHPHLDATEAVEIDGKTLSPEEIKTNANLLADEFESLNKNLGGYEKSVEAFERTHGLLDTQEKQGKTLMKNLKSKLEEIDVKKEAVEAMKSASGLAGDSSISDKFDKLADEVDNLFVDVETAMRIEEGKISDLQGKIESEGNSVDKILDEMDDTSRIDAILGISNDKDGGTPDDQ